MDIDPCIVIASQSEDGWYFLTENGRETMDLFDGSVARFDSVTDAADARRECLDMGPSWKVRVLSVNLDGSVA